MPMAKGIVRRGVLPTTSVSTASLASASNLYIKDPSGFLSGDIVGIADVNVAGNTNETRTISSITTASTTITDPLLVGGFFSSINVSDKTGFFIGLQFEIKGTVTNGDATTSVFNEFVTVAGSFVSGTGPSVIPLTTTGQNSYLAGAIVSFSYITFTAPLTNAHPIGSLVSEINGAQNSSVALRYNRYGDLASTQMGDSHSALCSEGVYYKACSGKTATEVISYGAPTLPVVPSPGFFTPIHSGSAMIAMLNTGTYGAGVRIYLDYIKLIVVSPVLTQAAEQHYVITVNNYDRYNTGAITDPTIAPQIVNTNSDYPNDSIAKLFFSSNGTNLSLNTQPSGIPRVVAKGIIKKNISAGVAFIAGDAFSIDFGDHKVDGQPVRANTVQRMYSLSNSPIDIGPGQFLSFHMYRAGAETVIGSATFHVEMGWWER